MLLTFVVCVIIVLVLDLILISVEELRSAKVEEIMRGIAPRMLAYNLAIFTQNVVPADLEQTEAKKREESSMS